LAPTLHIQRAVTFAVTSESSSQRRPERRVAVVLNANARSVTDEVIRTVMSVVDDRNDVFVSRSLEHAHFVARQIVRHEYDAVLSGGGDGTFMQTVSDIAALHPRRMPAVGVLRLGTGNALATALGAARADRRGIGADLARAGDVRADRELSLLSVDGKLAPFAGVGLDSLILSDYNAVKRSVAKTPLSGVMQGGAGYAAAIATRSFWRFTLGALPVVKIFNEGAPAERVSIDGRAVGAPVPRGGVIYHGPIAIAAASTIPFYGLGLKLFPQIERRPDRFQLRVGRVGAVSALLRLRDLFRGTFDCPTVYDFICTAVSIQVEAATSFQIGGDDAGVRRELRVGLTRHRAITGSRLPMDDAGRAARRRAA